MPVEILPDMHCNGMRWLGGWWLGVTVGTEVEVRQGREEKGVGESGKGRFIIFKAPPRAA